MKKTQKVVSSLVNSESKLSIVGTFQVIQDALTELMETLKVDGITEREKYNAFWVYTKTRVKFLKSLKWGEKMHIHVYISNISLAKLYIDMKIGDENGEIALFSRTELCALDITTQKIRKLTTVGITESMLEKHKNSNLTFAKFDVPETSIVDRVKIKYTNIDFCHHTNNLEYVRLIMNTYTVAEVEKNPIKEMEISYISQSFEGDEIDIKKTRLGTSDIFVLEKDTKAIAKCEIMF